MSPAARTRARGLIPEGSNVTVRAGRHTVQLTNLDKVYFPELGLTKRDLLEYYLEISPALLPHLQDRAMVMKRYPNGIHGKSFFMKRTPSPKPHWLQTCEIMHKSANLIPFPVVQDLASLLWIVNLGCIDLNPWYARCDDADRPDFLHFDLDPVQGTPFARVRETALIVRDALQTLGMQPFAKTTGATGMHVYVAIERGPLQKDVWQFAKALALELARRHPRLITGEFRVADRPRGHVLVDYNQNAWGRTLASIYSVRPNRDAAVSTPVTWEEVENGFEVADFRIDNVPGRARRLGDLWKPLLGPGGRFRLEQFEAAGKERTMARRRATERPARRRAASKGAAVEQSLAEYRRKRDFTRTAEPRGGRRAAAPKLAYVIQKHAARNVHFDLRLELDAVMKSWAVPKGPSLDPAVKRLAMQVEDHPIEYNQFEGTIPKGEYGGGTVMIWDRGSYTYGADDPDPVDALRRGYDKGELKFELKGKRLKGSWVLVRTRRGDPAKPQWLLIKHRDEFAEPGSDVVREFETSAATGRTMDEIAAGKRPRRSRS